MRIYLRPVTVDDAKIIVRWRNAPQVKKHCFIKEPITLESHMNFYKREVLTGHYKQYMVERVDEEFGVMSYSIATVYLKDMDKTNHRCQLCIFTSDDEEWNTESQTMAVKMLLDKAFKEFHMHKVYSYVFAEFSDEVELLNKVGFIKEALLKEEVITSDSIYGDVYRMAVYNPLL